MWRKSRPVANLDLVNFVYEDPVMHRGVFMFPYRYLSPREKNGTGFALQVRKKTKIWPSFTDVAFSRWKLRRIVEDRHHEIAQGGPSRGRTMRFGVFPPSKVNKTIGHVSCNQVNDIGGWKFKFPADQVISLIRSFSFCPQWEAETFSRLFSSCCCGRWNRRAFSIGHQQRFPSVTTMQMIWFSTGVRHSKWGNSEGSEMHVLLVGGGRNFPKIFTWIDLIMSVNWLGKKRSATFEICCRRNYPAADDDEWMAFPCT